MITKKEIPLHTPHLRRSSRPYISRFINSITSEDTMKHLLENIQLRKTKPVSYRSVVRNMNKKNHLEKSPRMTGHAAKSASALQQRVALTLKNSLHGQAI